MASRGGVARRASPRPVDVVAGYLTLYCCFEQAYGSTVFQVVPSLSTSAVHVGKGLTVDCGYCVGPARPLISHVWFAAAFCTFAGVMLLLPFFATVFSAWMNMSVDVYPAIVPLSTFWLAPGEYASSCFFMASSPDAPVVSSGSNETFAVLPSNAFTRTSEYSELMYVP